MTTEAERMNPPNFPGVVGNSVLLALNDGGGGGAGDPDNRTWLTDLLKALAIGVAKAENEVNLERVFFRLVSLVLFKSVKLEFSNSSIPTTPFFRLRFRWNCELKFFRQIVWLFMKTGHEKRDLFQIDEFLWEFDKVTEFEGTFENAKKFLPIENR